MQQFSSQLLKLVSYLKTVVHSQHQDDSKILVRYQIRSFSAHSRDLASEQKCIPCLAHGLVIFHNIAHISYLGRSST